MMTIAIPKGWREQPSTAKEPRRVFLNEYDGVGLGPGAYKAMNDAVSGAGKRTDYMRTVTFIELTPEVQAALDAHLGPEVPARKVWRYRHRLGFSDGTDYVEVWESGEAFLVYRDGSTKRSYAYKRDGCDRQVRIGNWIVEEVVLPASV